MLAGWTHQDRIRVREGGVTNVQLACHRLLEVDQVQVGVLALVGVDRARVQKHSPWVLLQAQQSQRQFISSCQKHRPVAASPSDSRGRQADRQASAEPLHASHRATQCSTYPQIEQVIEDGMSTRAVASTKSTNSQKPSSESSWRGHQRQLSEERRRSGRASHRRQGSLRNTSSMLG